MWVVNMFIMGAIKVNFIVGRSYTRKDIYIILNIPIEKQGGNWNTGYNRVGEDWYVFVNINTPGRTGHDYENKLDGDRLVWFGKNGSKLSQKSIQSMISSQGQIFVFTRTNSNNPNFLFAGTATVIKFFDTVPVKVEWKLEGVK